MAKTILITGANRGLGYALSEKLAAEGHTIIMVCRDAKKAEHSFNILKSKGYSVVLKEADMADTTQIDALFESISKEFEVVDVLVNNAAINADTDDTTIENISLELVQNTFNTNIVGPLWMCKKALPLIRKSDDGRIINYSSGLGHLTVPRMGPYPAYSISKTAVNALTQNLANELEGTGITVVSLDPGWVRTDMGGPNAMLSIEEGLETPYWLITADKTEIENGKFYKEKKVLPW